MTIAGGSEKGVVGNSKGPDSLVFMHLAYELPKPARVAQGQYGRERANILSSRTLRVIAYSEACERLTYITNLK